MKLFGLSGYAQAGKDSVGKILINSGYVRLAFADALRDGLYAMDPWIQVEPVEDEWGVDADPRRLQDAVDCVGWDDAKRIYPEVRRLLQTYGTEGGREVHGDDCWISVVKRKILDAGMPEADRKFVITDVRFPNEAELVRSLGGYLVRVTRPGTEPAGEHVSERALDRYPFDFHVFNDSTLAELQTTVQIELPSWV